MKKNSIVLIVALVVLVAIYFLVSSSLKNNEENLPVENELENGDIFCTMDAMECEDGSFVGRVAPDCEFAACPGDEGLIVEEEVAGPELIEVPILDEPILDEPILEEPIFDEEEPEMIELIVE